MIMDVDDLSIRLGYLWAFKEGGPFEAHGRSSAPLSPLVELSLLAHTAARPGVLSVGGAGQRVTDWRAPAIGIEVGTHN